MFAAAFFMRLEHVMAVLDRIVVQDFRNIELGELAFSPNVNCISGNNGEGKTNLMDAIYYLSMTKSAFSTSDRFNFRFGCQSFALSGSYTMENGLKSVVSVQVGQQGEKKLRRDDKAYKKISEHIGCLPIVMVSPQDSVLVSESGEERRRFANSVLSQVDRQYLSDMQQYNRLLMQRNKALKEPSPDPALLEVFDARMAGYAASVYAKRKEFIAKLSPVVASYYTMLSGDRERVGITYDSDLERGGLEELLALCRERDLMMRFTTAGIQRDDLVFTMNGHPIRRCGSQGQQKSFLVSLKFAQYELMKKEYGFAPMLLLDDVFDKLDLSRISNLLRMVAGREFGQIFITDSNKVRLSGIVDQITSDSAYFDTVAGTFTRQ